MQDREARIDALLDRQAIIEALQSYARGVDRLDQDTFRRAFHPDARDFHSGHISDPQQFIDYFWPQQDTRITCQHYVTNPTIELDGDTAHSEAYYFAINRQVDDPTVRLSGGRYVDKLEKRDGEWRITTRVVVSEWMVSANGSTAPPPVSRRDASDLSYARPLEGL